MELLLLGGVVFVASAVGTMTGFGVSTVMIPVALLFYPMLETLLFVGVIHWFGNVWKLLLFREGIRWKLVLSFGAPGIIASYLGAMLVSKAPESLLSRLLGIFIIIYVIYLFINPLFKVKQNNLSAVFGGAVSGFLAGIFGMGGGAVRGLFLSSFNLPKAVYIATAGAIALAIDTTRLAKYYSQGTRLEGLVFWGMLIFIPVSFLGARVARLFVDRIPERYFRTVVAVFLFLIAVKLIILPA